MSRSRFLFAAVVHLMLRGPILTGMIMFGVLLPSLFHFDGWGEGVCGSALAQVRGRSRVTATSSHDVKGFWHEDSKPHHVRANGL